MDIGEIEAFLTLADELHFARAGQRLYLSGARVGQRIQAMEREIGGALFERSSRRVALTPLGARFRKDVEPAFEALRAAYRAASADARSDEGVLRLGATFAAGAVLDHLAVAFERAVPACELRVLAVQITDPYGPLHRGEVDVIVHWQVGNPPGLIFGPVLRTEPRVVAMAGDHPLAGRDSVTVEDLGDYLMVQTSGIDEEIQVAFIPRTTPGGRPINFFPQPVQAVMEAISLVARGHVIHPTVPSIRTLLHDTGIVLRPLEGLPPLELGLIWCTAHENARIRSLARVATTLPVNPGPVADS